MDLFSEERPVKALTTLVGRLSVSVGWVNGPERELKTVSANSADPDQMPGSVSLHGTLTSGRQQWRGYK